MNLLGNLREDIRLARLYKPRWRVFFRIIGIVKMLISLSIVGCFVFGIWYILYGYLPADGSVPAGDMSQSESSALAPRGTEGGSIAGIANDTANSNKTENIAPQFADQHSQGDELTMVRAALSKRFAMKNRGGYIDRRGDVDADVDVSANIMELAGEDSGSDSDHSRAMVAGQFIEGTQPSLDTSAEIPVLTLKLPSEAGQRPASRSAATLDSASSDVVPGSTMVTATQAEKLSRPKPLQATSEPPFSQSMAGQQNNSSPQIGPDNKKIASTTAADPLPGSRSVDETKSISSSRRRPDAQSGSETVAQSKAVSNSRRHRSADTMRVAKSAVTALVPMNTPLENKTNDNKTEKSRPEKSRPEKSKPEKSKPEKSKPEKSKPNENQLAKSHPENKLTAATAVDDGNLLPNDPVKSVTRQIDGETTVDALVQVPVTSTIAAVSGTKKLASSTAVQTVPKLAPASPASVLDIEWLQDQPEDSYLIQIGSSQNKSFLVNFAKILPNELSWAMYPYRQNNSGATVYALCAGRFSSKHEATRALDELPNKIKRYGAFVQNTSEAQLMARKFNPQ